MKTRLCQVPVDRRNVVLSQKLFPRSELSIAEALPRSMRLAVTAAKASAARARKRMRGGRFGVSEPCQGKTQRAKQKRYNCQSESCRMKRLSTTGATQRQKSLLPVQVELKKSSKPGTNETNDVGGQSTLVNCWIAVWRKCISRLTKRTWKSGVVLRNARGCAASGGESSNDCAVATHTRCGWQASRIGGA